MPYLYIHRASESPSASFDLLIFSLIQLFLLPQNLPEIQETSVPYSNITQPTTEGRIYPSSTAQNSTTHLPTMSQRTKLPHPHLDQRGPHPTNLDLRPRTNRNPFHPLSLPPIPLFHHPHHHI